MRQDSVSMARKKTSAGLTYPGVRMDVWRDRMVENEALSGLRVAVEGDMGR